MDVVVMDKLGRRAKAFMIGGFPEPVWFERLVDQGVAVISQESDLRSEDYGTVDPFVDPKGQTAVAIFSNPLEPVVLQAQTGDSGDWVVMWTDNVVEIWKEHQFLKNFVILKSSIKAF
jgi:hypothetical protein